MIRFSCPSCAAVMTASESKAGEKGACPKCGQRVEVPRVTPNKTILGELLPKAVPAAVPFAAEGAPVAQRVSDAALASDVCSILGIIFGGVGLGFVFLSWLTCGATLLLSAPASLAGFVIACCSHSRQRPLAVALSASGLGLSVVTWVAIFVARKEIYGL